MLSTFTSMDRNAVECAIYLVVFKNFQSIKNIFKILIKCWRKFSWARKLLWPAGANANGILPKIRLIWFDRVIIYAMPIKFTNYWRCDNFLYILVILSKLHVFSILVHAFGNFNSFFFKGRRNKLKWLKKYLQTAYNGSNIQAFSVSEAVQIFLSYVNRFNILVIFQYMYTGGIDFNRAV